jgi:hypothetical protein
MSQLHEHSGCSVATAAGLADIITHHSCSQILLFHGVNTVTVAMTDTSSELS